MRTVRVVGVMWRAAARVVGGGLVTWGRGVVMWHATVVHAHAWPEWALARGGRRRWAVVVVVGRKEVMGNI